jgi:glycosyltransferase involved in cell wall biosynthesis
MRIAHLIYDDLQNPWLAGGGAVRADEIYRRLAGRHEVTLVTGAFPGSQTAETRAGVDLVRVGRAATQVRSRLQYCRGAMAALKGLAWDVWVHEFSAFAPLWPSAALRRRGVLFFYHFVGHHALRKHPLVGLVSWLAETLTLRAYPRVLTISPSVQEEVRRRLGGRRVEVDCVFTGVDARYFSLVPQEEPYLLYFGRLDPHTKGLDVLIAAFARIAATHPGVTLKIAGRGTPASREAVLRLAARAGVGQQVELIGGVDEEQKGELLRRCLFVCMPSRYEGWGIVAVEAAAAAKPVLGTCIAGLRDAVRDGETGILVPSGDAPALAEAMSVLLADGERRRNMGGHGREWARRFDWDRIARDQEQVLLRAAGLAEG